MEELNEEEMRGAEGGACNVTEKKELFQSRSAKNAVCIEVPNEVLYIECLELDTFDGKVKLKGTIHKEDNRIKIMNNMTEMGVASWNGNTFIFKLHPAWKNKTTLIKLGWNTTAGRLTKREKWFRFGF